MSYTQSDGRITTYPNQAPGISDQNWRVASNLSMAISRGALMNTENIARILQVEYGNAPDHNLSVRLDKLEFELSSLKDDIQKQLAAYNPPAGGAA